MPIKSITGRNLLSLEVIGLFGSMLTFVLGITYVIWLLSDITYFVSDCNQALPGVSRANCNQSFMLIFPLDLMTFSTIWGPTVVGIYGMLSAVYGTSVVFYDVYGTLLRGAVFSAFMGLFANFGYAWAVGFAFGLVNFIISIVLFTLVGLDMCRNRRTRRPQVDTVQTPAKDSTLSVPHSTNVSTAYPTPVHVAEVEQPRVVESA